MARSSLIAEHRGERTLAGQLGLNFTTTPAAQTAIFRIQQFHSEQTLHDQRSSVLETPSFVSVYRSMPGRRWRETARYACAWNAVSNGDHGVPIREEKPKQSLLALEKAASNCEWRTNGSYNAFLRKVENSHETYVCRFAGWNSSYVR